MGVVFEAEETSLRRRVALKVLHQGLVHDATAKRRFLREAQAAASVTHDNIVPIHHVGEDRGVPYLAMPMLRGETLESKLGREGRLPAREAVRIAREVAEGLAAAHERGLLHRDVKPGNIWIEEGSGRVKLLDFGLARSDRGGETLTEVGIISGTPEYMSPEQAAGEGLGPASDVYSLGCVLYRMCAGRTPLSGKTSVAVLAALASRKPRPPHEVSLGVPRELSRMIMRSLEKDPRDRPTSAVAVREILARIEEGLERPAPESSSTSWGRWAAAFGVALIVAILLAALVFSRAAAGGTVVVEVNEGGAVVSVAGMQGIRVTSGDNESVRIDLRAGHHGIHVSKDGFTTESLEVTLEAGKTETVRVRLERVVPIDPDRRAAEWVLGLGGVIDIRPHPQDQLSKVDNRGQLPAAGFKVVRIHLGWNEKLTDEGLGNLEGLTQLEELVLSYTGVGDRGLRRLEKLKSVRRLCLENTKVTDDGLFYLRGLTQLFELLLGGAKISDRDRLTHLSELKLLRSLGLNNTAVGDESISTINRFPELDYLNLGDTRVTQQGIARLREWRNLRRLAINGGPLDDDAVPILQRYRTLQFLAVQKTGITVKGLSSLTGMKELEELLLDERAAAGGVEGLKVFPALRRLLVNGRKFMDPDLDGLSKLTRLTSLDLVGTSVTDNGLLYVAGAKGLQDLFLSDTNVTPDGLTHLLALKQLRRLSLPGPNMTDDAIESLSRLKTLDEINVGDSRLSDAGLRRLREALPRCQITR